MKIIIDVPATKKKPRMVTVALQHDDEVLMSFRPEKYYKLGGQVDDVVQGHVITESDAVYWCSIGQRWEEA
jgi:hypothetical protein